MAFDKSNYLQKTKWKTEMASIALWAILNLADLIITIASMIALNGGFVEGNPIASLIGENIAVLAGYKLVLTFIVIVLLSYIKKLYLLQWLNIIMSAVIGWNLALFFIS